MKIFTCPFSIDCTIGHINTLNVLSSNRYTILSCNIMDGMEFLVVSFFSSFQKQNNPRTGQSKRAR